MTKDEVIAEYIDQHRRSVSGRKRRPSRAMIRRELNAKFQSAGISVSVLQLIWFAFQVWMKLRKGP